MKNQVIGVYETNQQAARVVEKLKEKGYTTEEISVIAKNPKELTEITQEVKPSTKDGAIAGAATGGAIGIAGVIVGLSTILIPGFGAVKEGKKGEGGFDRGVDWREYNISGLGRV